MKTVEHSVFTLRLLSERVSWFYSKCSGVCVCVLMQDRCVSIIKELITNFRKCSLDLL